MSFRLDFRIVDCENPSELEALKYLDDFPLLSKVSIFRKFFFFQIARIASIWSAQDEEFERRVKIKFFRQIIILRLEEMRWYQV